MTATSERFIAVARVGEIAAGSVKVARIEDTAIAIFRVGDDYFAMDDACSHDGGPLAEGFIEGDEIECPRHGARFNVRTGAALCLPATGAVSTYAVRIVGDEIQVGWQQMREGGEASSAAVPAASATAVAGDAAAAPSVATGAAVDAPSDGADAASAPIATAPVATDSAASPDGSKPAPSQQEIAVRSALESVMDPEIGLSVIDLGLIREVLFPPGLTFVKMMLTTPFCPYAPQMMADVKQATEAVVPQPCEVEIMPDPWSPDLMPDPGLLGYSF